MRPEVTCARLCGATAPDAETALSLRWQHLPPDWWVCAECEAAEPVRIGPVAAMRWGDGPDGFALSREALLAEMARYGSAGRSDDYTDALALAWQSAPDAWVRRADMERRAVERTGRVLVAWLIGRCRR